MSIFLEIGIEVIAFLMISYVLARIAYASVRIEERSTPDPKKRKIAFVRGDDGMARELREEYADRNEDARYDSGTYISLPSVTSFGVLSGIAGFIMTVLVAIFHLAGIAGIGISGPVSQDTLDDAYLGTAAFILPFIVMVFGVIFYKWMRGIAMNHARQYADARVRKGRYVYIFQRFSAGEKIARKKIRRADERAEKRAKKRAKERELAAGRNAKSNNVIDIKKAI